MSGSRIRVFVPGKLEVPDIPVIIPDGSLPISGKVRMPRGVARGVVRDGRVVSWAVAREPDEKGVRHITVETDRCYRKRGYARACLQALARDVQEPMLYLCEEKNENSAKTALSAGFVELENVVE